MARKTRKRVSYVLQLPNLPAGHRLGVNGLAVDSSQSILYSGGRDGLICSWDLGINLQRGPDTSLDNPLAPSDAGSKVSGAPSSNRRQMQAHTHWVNDILLTHDNSALVSASSDLTVKLWRPNAYDNMLPQTIGLHSDYVKCVKAPSHQSDWVASGGLDRKIYMWDLNGGGQKLKIEVDQEERTEKGSVYALAVGGGILASGGPESIVRVWDPRSGKRITKFVGHTDNIRDVLINATGDMIMTASSDQTVKVWSVAAGRCVHTLTMHNDSVWSLHSDHPQLSVFYSGDRSGLVAKTDVRGSLEMDDGICLAALQEHDGVSKVVASGGYIWTATSSSSINRWLDVDTEGSVSTPEYQHHHRASSATSRYKTSPSNTRRNPSISAGMPKKQIPHSANLRLSSTAAYPTQFSYDADTSTLYSTVSGRKLSEGVVDADNGVITPVHSLPDECVEGQNGLIKHIMLNDRRRVLTLDTAGEVVMWDLLKCIPLQSFGKRHLEDIAPEVNTLESIANWCTVDTRTGRLACVLEENSCFDGEMYADELRLDQNIDFKDDQRLNYGKWVLRYLFSNLIDEEIRRDELYRRSLKDNTDSQIRRKAPSSIHIPPASLAGWDSASTLLSDSATTPRALNGGHHPPVTPGLSIGVMTPGSQAQQGALADSHLFPPLEEDNELDKRTSRSSQPSMSTDRTSDYFGSGYNASQSLPSAEGGAKGTSNNTDHSEDSSNQGSVPSADGEKDNPVKESTSLFGKKFKMPSFNTKKLSRITSAETRPAAVDEKSEDSDESSKQDMRANALEESFFGCIQKLQNDYAHQLQQHPGQDILSGITPSLPNETPVLKPPLYTTVIIQEDRPDSGGVADIYRGTVGSVGADADTLERVAPNWLADLLLRNQIPLKDPVKVSFVLNPWGDLLPSIATADGPGQPGNARLNANRMLRVRKVCGYVAERIEPQPEKPDPEALKPEEYLEIHCQDQIVPPTMTLATLRAYVWKNAGDVLLYYKNNGRKKILGELTPEEVAERRRQEAEELSKATVQLIAATSPEAAQ